jgi:hypothetical protein
VAVAEVAETEEHPLALDEIRAKIAEAKRKRDAANLKRDTKGRRKAEHKQSKRRVNPALLRGQGEARDETWSFRAKPSHIRAVKALAEDLSQPGAKVSIAALMDQAVELLLAYHRNSQGTQDDGEQA